MTLLRYFVLLGFLMCAFANAQAQAPTWFQTVGGSSVCYTFGLHTDANNNVYNTGYFEDSTAFDPLVANIQYTASGSDLYVQKTEPSGNVLWVKEFGTLGATLQGQAITTDAAGDVYVAGYLMSNSSVVFGGTALSSTPVSSSADVFILKLNGTDGTAIWTNFIKGGTTSDRADVKAITINETNGKVLLAGSFMGVMDFDPFNIGGELSAAAGKDGFVLVLNTNDGAFGIANQWTGTGSNDVCTGVRVKSTGDYYVTGYFDGTIDIDPGAGTVQETTAGGSDVFVVKMSQANNYATFHSILQSNGSAFIEAKDMEIDGNDNVYVAGSFYGGGGQISTYKMVPGGINSFTTAPTTGSSGQPTGFAVKFSASFSSIEWSQYFNDGVGSGYCNVLDMAVTYDTVYLAGIMSGVVDFDIAGAGGSINTTGSWDENFICKLHTAAGDFGNTQLIGGGNITNNMHKALVNIDGAGNMTLGGNFTGNGDFNLNPAINFYVNNPAGNYHFYVAQYGTVTLPNHPDSVALWLLSQNLRDADSLNILDNPGAFALYTGSKIPWDFNNMSFIGNWYGITVDGSNRVTSVDLSNMASDLGITMGINNNLPTGLFGNGGLAMLQTMNLANCGVSAIPINFGNGSSSNFFKMDISNNHLDEASMVVELLNSCPNLTSFFASNCMSPSATDYTFNTADSLPHAVVFDTVVLNNNNFLNLPQVPLNLDYFLKDMTLSAANTYISLSGNSFDSLKIFPIGNYYIDYLDISNNKFNQTIPPALFNNLREVQTFNISNNLFKGLLPAPPGANYECFTNAATSRIDLSANQLEGDLRLDWLLGWLTSTSVLRGVYLDSNHFKNVVPFDPNNTLPASIVMGVQNVTTHNNKLGFDDLEKVATSFKMLGNNNPNIGGQFQYTPLAAADLGGFPDPASFMYSPQDTVGLGGTRHKEPGSTIVFEEDVPTTGLLGTTEYVWTRTDITNSARQLLSYHQIPAIGPTITFLEGIVTMTLPSINSPSLVSFLSVTSNLSVPAVNNTHTLTNNEGLQFNNADSVYGGMFTETWRYAIQAYNSNFPLLEIVSRPKRLIVGPCYDNSGQVIQCQQAFGQFNGNFSAQKTGIVLTEAEKQALRDQIGVTVIKSCPCGDLEMWEISDTTYQNYLLSNGKGTRNVATANGGKPGLLSANSDYQLDDSTATPKPAPAATVTGNPNSPNAVRVAIIDSGVDYDHPALQNHILAPISHPTDSCSLNEFGYNFIDTAALPYDDFRHGTRVAGVLAGEANTTNTMMFDASNNDIALMSFKYTDAYANGTLFNATCGMYMAIENGAKVINASWGYWGDECPALQEAIKYAAQKGALLVCAAGNHHHDNITFSPDTMVHWPSAYGYTERLDTNFNLPNIITVAAIDENNPEVLASYSNFGFDLVHLATEGTVITTAIDTVGNVNETATDEGTSFAAPKVSRTVALLWAEFPTASFCEIKEALRLGIDTLQSSDANNLAWKGRLNYSKARQVLADSLGLFAACQISSTPNTPNTAPATLVLSPNPFGSYIHLQWIDNSNYNAAADIRIFSIDGRLRYQANTANNFETISTAEWQAGLYILQVKRNGKIYTEKIVKY